MECPNESNHLILRTSEQDSGDMYLLDPCATDDGDDDLASARNFVHPEGFRLPLFEPWYTISNFTPRIRVWPSKLRECLYADWVDRVASKFSSFWKDIGIYDMIMYSRSETSHDAKLIMSLLGFWSTATNCFVFPFGFLGPTLLDVTVILGLESFGDDLPSRSHELKEIGPEELGINHNSDTRHYSTFIRANQQLGDVTDSEHNALLLLWICRSFICTGSVAVVREYSSYVAALVEKPSRKYALGTLFLSNLFRGMRVSLERMKGGESLPTVTCPFWFLKLWFYLYFPDFIPGGADTEQLMKDQPTDILAYGLAVIEENPDLIENITKTIMAQQNRSDVNFYALKKFSAKWPFSRFSCHRMWESVLVPRDLSLGTHLTSRHNKLGFEPYYPQCLERQFGLVQNLPKPYRSHSMNNHRPQVREIEIQDQEHQKIYECLDMKSFKSFDEERGHSQRFEQFWDTMRRMFFTHNSEAHLQCLHSVDSLLRELRQSPLKQKRKPEGKASPGRAQTEPQKKKKTSLFRKYTISSEHPGLDTVRKKSSSSTSKASIQHQSPISSPSIPAVTCEPHAQQTSAGATTRITTETTTEAATKAVRPPLSLKSRKKVAAKRFKRIERSESGSPQTRNKPSVIPKVTQPTSNLSVVTGEELVSLHQKRVQERDTETELIKPLTNRTIADAIRELAFEETDIETSQPTEVPSRDVDISLSTVQQELSIVVFQQEELQQLPVQKKGTLSMSPDLPISTPAADQASSVDQIRPTITNPQVESSSQATQPPIIPAVDFDFDDADLPPSELLNSLKEAIETGIPKGAEAASALENLLEQIAVCRRPEIPRSLRLSCHSLGKHVQTIFTTFQLHENCLVNLEHKCAQISAVEKQHADHKAKLDSCSQHQHRVHLEIDALQRKASDLKREINRLISEHEIVEKELKNKQGFFASLNLESEALIKEGEGLKKMTPSLQRKAPLLKDKMDVHRKKSQLVKTTWEELIEGILQAMNPPNHTIVPELGDKTEETGSPSDHLISDSRTVS